MRHALNSSSPTTHARGGTLRMKLPEGADDFWTTEKGIITVTIPYTDEV